MIHDLSDLGKSGEFKRAMSEMCPTRLSCFLNLFKGFYFKEISNVVQLKWHDFEAFIVSGLQDASTGLGQCFALGLLRLTTSMLHHAVKHKLLHLSGSLLEAS